MRTRSILALACATLAVALPMQSRAADDAVQVTYPDDTRYTDAGEGEPARQANEAILTRHLQALGRQTLRPGEQLQIAVHDIDLAGRVEPTSRIVPPPRVLKGAADFPRIRLTYTLTTADGTQRTGDETVSDLNYLHQRASTLESPLPYERRMLTQWFRGRFATSTASN